jgi:hypothetical protein
MGNGPYYDLRTLGPQLRPPSACPVANCSAVAGVVDSQWGPMPYCSEHGLRIHRKTFAYYDPTSPRVAALRNIVFEQDLFGTSFLGNAAKAETHRICHENSEDALTWNVFVRLARAGALSELFSTLTGRGATTAPELYLWGLRVDLRKSGQPANFLQLDAARRVFEVDIRKFHTEPDIMLHVPGQFLLLIEAKFTSGNTLAEGDESGDIVGEKPRSRAGLLHRYSSATSPGGVMLVPPASGPFYSQLYRNAVFANHMATALGVKWGVVNLVSESQRLPTEAFADPTPFMRSLLPAESQGLFRRYTWERLYTEHAFRKPGLSDLEAYMCNKSASGGRAFAV